MMEKDKQSNDALRLEQDALIARLIPDASQVPDVQVLVGFLGKSTREGYWRLYLTIILNEYVEFDEKDVVHRRAFECDESRLGGTMVWIRRGANLQHTQSVSREAQADFLQGGITASAFGRDPGRPSSGPVQVAPQQAMFLSFAGHANSCVSDICNNFMGRSFMGGGDVNCGGNNPFVTWFGGGHCGLG
jgi:hypothetical protein